MDTPATKVCNFCQKSQLLATAFSKHKNSKDGYRQPCKTCLALKVAIKTLLAKSFKIIDFHIEYPIDAQQCITCLHTKHISAFPVSSTSKNGKAKQCCICTDQRMQIEGKKVCTSCGIEKYLVEFIQDKRRQSGRGAICQSCKHIYNQQYYENNQPAILRQKVGYYIKNHEEIRSNQSIYHETHKEDIATRHRRNRKQRNANRYAWSRNNPERVRATRQRRRARKKQAPVNDLSQEQWLEILVAFDFRCVYCPATCKDCKKKTHKLTPDHITPYAANGSNTLWNVVPACISHNSKKNTGPVLNPVQPLLLTLAPPKPTRRRG